MLPKFIKGVMKNPYCGTFRLGRAYDARFWCQPNNSFFITKCRELHPLNNIVSYRRLIVLTDNLFLVLEPDEGNYTKSEIVAWSFLYSLVRVKVLNQTSIQFHWLPKDDDKNCWEQVFKLNNPGELLREVLSRMEKLKAEVHQINKGKKRKMLSEEDVTPEALENFNIHQIDENIALCESSLEVEPEISKFQTLMLLYQKVRNNTKHRQLSITRLKKIRYMNCM